MKRILSLLLTASLAAGAVCLNACTAKQEEPSDPQAVTELKAETGSHTLYFKDSGKAETARTLK